MPKKPDYASLYTLRADGRYQGYWRDAQGKRHALCDRDPARLYARLLEREQPTETPPVTFGDAAKRWWDVRSEQLAYKSVEAYKPVFRRLMARFGAEPLEDVETRDVSAYLATLAQEGYARRTVQLHRDMMSQIYNHAIGEGVTRTNPCDHAVMPRGLAAGTRGIASPETIEAVKGGLAQPFGLFAFVCLYAGLRRGEALALRHEDIDRAAGVIHVTKSVEYVGNTARLKEPKTQKGRRDVILLDVLAAAIPEGKGYLFHGADGALLSRDGYRKRWAAYCKAIGCDELTAHQLRHAYATLLYEAGVGDKDAQEQLGHANITLTRDVYTHISAVQRQKTAQRLNGYLDTRKEKSGENGGKLAAVREILELMDGQDAGEIFALVASELAKKAGNGSR